MALPVGPEDLKKLKSFIDFVSSNPTILNFPQLSFVKDFIEKFGGKVPSGEFKMPAGGGCPFGSDKSDDVKADSKTTEPEEEEMESESESESDLDLDMEGVIEADVVGDQPMGDSSKEPTEEEIDEASDLRTNAAGAYSQQKYQEAIDLYTQAIELNPGNALFHAKRGQAYLKLKKPNACIRDCDKALEINCDSAAAYKFRGRAHRLLGNWELAAKDLRQACKLDFDEEADEWLREVTPNAKKIEQHRIKQERKLAEKELKKRSERINKAQEANKKAREQQQKSGDDVDAGAPESWADILSDLKDPELKDILADISTNPANIHKYASNPKIAKTVELIKGMCKDGSMPPGFPGNFPGMPAGFPGMGGGMPPGGFPGFGGGNSNAGGAAAPPKSEPKKPDFVDDGLD